VVLVSPGRRRPAAGAARDHRAGSGTLRLRPGEPSVELWCLDLADADGRGPWGDAVMDYFKKSNTKQSKLSSETVAALQQPAPATAHRVTALAKGVALWAPGRIYSREALPAACESHTACHAVGFTVLAAHGTFTFHRMVSGRPEATRAAACSSGPEPRRAVASRVSRLSVSERCSASSCCACQKELNHNRHTIHLAFAATLRPRSPLLGPLSFQPPPCPPLHVYIIRA